RPAQYEQEQSSQALTVRLSAACSLRQSSNTAGPSASTVFMVGRSDACVKGEAEIEDHCLAQWMMAAPVGNAAKRRGTPRTERENDREMLMQNLDGVINERIGWVDDE